MIELCIRERKGYSNGIFNHIGLPGVVDWVLEGPCPAVVVAPTLTVYADAGSRPPITTLLSLLGTLTDCVCLFAVRLTR